MTVGSRWYKFDFHNHTPASNDYRAPAITPREWLLAYMRQQVDCVVISDHNSGAWIDVLKVELEQMRQEVNANTGDIPDFRPLTLFPGVELTATGNVHILAVLHTDSSSTDVERLVAQCNNNSPIPRDAQNHQLVLQLGPAGIINNIRRHPEAVCILAHIDAVKGVLQSLTNQRELEAAFSEKPHAVEIRGRVEDINDDGTHRRLIQDLPWLRGSDAHHPEQAGVRTCWLKMSTPDFDGLRHALLDPENCVLFDDNPPEAPTSHLRSLTFRTRYCRPADQNGAFVEFSPFYNAVIGSRGSGKSTLIESIRLAMRKTEGLTVSQSDKLNQFSQTGMGMEADSFIECVFRKEGTDFRLSWRPGSRHELHIFSEGQWVQDSYWSADRFPLSIYSQKMLYELASDTGAFLRVCDESPVVNKRAWKERWDQLEREYLNEQITLRGYMASQTIAGTLQGELSDAERAVSQLRSSAYYPVCTRLATARAELSAATIPLDHHEQRVADLRAQEPVQVPVPLEESSAPLAAFMTRLLDVQQQYEQRLDTLLSDYAAEFSAIRHESSLLALVEAVRNQEETVQREAIVLREQGLNPDVLDELMTRCESLKSELRNYADLDEVIAASVSRSEQLLADMRAHRMELTENRKAFLSSLSLSDLEIKILPLCAPHGDILAGYQAVTGISNFAERIYDNDDRSGLLSRFISLRPFSPLPAETERKYVLLNELKALHVAIRAEETGAGAELHGTFRNRLKTLNEAQLDALQCWYPDDGIHIRYRSPGGQMEDISSASPGQKGASMLQFLLSYGTDPLLLDQPEDDLDCLMLSMGVIPAIMSNKKRRQLIIVSHSAPIVVNGDAEYVISMKHDRTGLSPGLCGALQEAPMKALICQQMEGGEKAFRSRYERILS